MFQANFWAWNLSSSPFGALILRDIGRPVEDVLDLGDGPVGDLLGLLLEVGSLDDLGDEDLLEGFAARSHLSLVELHSSKFFFPSGQAKIDSSPCGNINLLMLLFQVSSLSVCSTIWPNSDTL